MSEHRTARFPWGLTIVSLLAFVLLVSLGVWQVQRLQWKQGLIARAEAAADLPPVSLEALAQMQDPEFRTAVLVCDFQNGRWVELQSIQDVEVGVRLIASCDGWLVDLRVEGPGAAAPPPEGNRFYARDTEAMSRALGVEGPVPPYVLFATGSAWPGWEALQPSAPPAAFSNNHLGYALTWFGLALALAGFYIALLRRKLTS